MQELEISGKNIEEAIASGLKELNCAKEDVEIKILDEGTTGLFGLMGSKPARVLLTMKNKCTDINVDIDLACKNAKKVITDIVSMMNINLQDITVKNEQGCVNITLTTDSGSLLIGRGGQSLDSLEYIVQLIINNNPNTRIKVNIDTEGYRVRQQEKLKTIIQKAIDYVNRTKKIYRFDPMSAKERKFIHTYFKSMDGFDTFSEGNGNSRKVGVKLSANNK